MPALMSCPHGHQWEDLFDDEPSLNGSRCPVCGISLEEMPDALLAEAAQLPPTRRIQPPTSPFFETSSPEHDGSALGNHEAPPALEPATKDVPTVAGPQEEPQPAISAPLFQGYAILEELGRGGMGVVYKARQLGLNRLVALKMILGGNYAGEAQRRRFRQEAQAVARLHHLNIVQIYDVGEQEGHPYFTLEYVDGGSLSDRFRNGPLPPRQAAHLVAVLAEAIHCAHEHGIVHRDLKPANVLLASDGTPKITDFGLAKLLDGDDFHTRTGSVVGTPSYMAPEQALGQNKSVGPAADIYALGSILYEALTGRPPFRGESSMDLLIRLAKEDPERLSRVRPGVPHDLETVCLKCLEKEPRKRYESAQALAEDLHRFLAHEPVRARPATSWERAVKWVKRHPTKAAFLSCVLLAALGFLGQAAFLAAGGARTERLRLEKVRAEIRDVLMRAQVAVQSEAWGAAEELLTSADTRIAAEPALGSIPDEASGLVAYVRGRLTAHQTLQQFSQRRDEALFHTTLSVGEGSANDLRAARDKAREALELVGLANPAEQAWSLDGSFTTEEKDEVREKSYELLLVLAEVEGQPLSGQTAEVQRGRAAEALRILDRAVALGVRTKAYHLRRARFLELAGEPDAALQEAAKGVRQPPQSALDHYLLGDELYRQGSPQKASDEFQMTLRDQPNHFWAHYFLALCYVRLQRPDVAHENLTICLGQHRDIVWIYLMRGFASGQLEDYPAAEADFAQALRLLEEKPNEDARYVLYNNRAIVRVGQKDFEGAIGDLRQAIVVRPRQYQAYASLAQTLHLLKRPADAVGQLDEAIKAAEPLVRSQEVEAPTLALLYRTRARFQREQKDHEAALADLERAVALATESSPLLAQTHVERGQVLVLSGRPEEALEAFEAAVKARPRHAPAHRGRGEVLFGLKRYADAIKAFTAYLQSEGPPVASVYQARALARVRLGNPKAALDDFTFALQHEPDNATLRTQRGQAYLACQSEKQQLALDDFEKAIASNPNNGPAYSGRARARVELGQLAQAVTDAEKALQLGPRSAGVVYGAAALYARAVGKIDASAESKGRPDLESRERYCDRAIVLLGQAMQLLPEDQRGAFWRDTVQRDIALAAIRHSIEFARLRRQFSSVESAPQFPTGAAIPPGVRSSK